MNPDLLRQRRNLVAISTGLLIFDFAKMKIAKISLLGTEILVGDAQVLMVFAWVVWFYFLLRYYQYWRSEPHHLIRQAFLHRFDRYAHDFSQVKAVQDNNGEPYNDYKIVRASFAGWTYTLQGYNPTEGAIHAGTSVSLPAWRLTGWAAKSAAHVCFQTPHVTDHALPFLLAFAAPVISIMTKWQLLGWSAA